MPLLLAFFLGTVGSAEAAELAGVHLEPALRVGGQTLRLSSCGVRDTFWVDHYVAGLYLPEGASPRAAGDEGQPKAVRLKVVQARYLPDNVPEKWREALRRELAREPMMRVRQAYDRLSDGDVVTFTYLPEEGVTMTVNARTVIRTPGHAVIETMLEAWSEKDPISGQLRRLALDHPC